MRFFADQDIYESTSKFLFSLGHEVLRCKDAGLATAADEKILQYAYASDYIVITRDKNFGAPVFVGVIEEDIGKLPPHLKYETRT